MRCANEKLHASGPGPAAAPPRTAAPSGHAHRRPDRPVRLRVRRLQAQGIQRPPLDLGPHRGLAMNPPLTLREVTESAAEISDIYAGKYGIARDDDWYLLQLQEELGELAQAHLRLSSRGRGEACGA